MGLFHEINRDLKSRLVTLEYVHCENDVTLIFMIALIYAAQFS